MGTNQRPLPEPVPPTMPGSNSIDAEQTSYKHYIDAITDGMFHARGQAPRPDANDLVFQPSPARIVGDLTTGMPTAGYPAQGVEAVAGGRGILVAGADRNVAPAPDPEPTDPTFGPDTSGRGMHVPAPGLAPGTF